MKTWPKLPVIYEINTWAWLYELSRMVNIIDWKGTPGRN